MKTFPTTVKTGTIVKRFFKEFSRNPSFFVYISVSILASTFYTFDTYIVARMVDSLRLYWIGQNTLHDVYEPFYWLIGLWTITWILYRIQDFAVSRSQIQIAKNVYKDIFTYLHHHAHQYFTDNFAGSLFKRVSRYVRAFEDFSDTLVYRIIPLLVQLIATVVIIFIFSPLWGSMVIIYGIWFCVKFLFDALATPPHWLSRSCRFKIFRLCHRYDC